jgi:nucleoside-diphosphate-sugar epimerase
MKELTMKYNTCVIFGGSGFIGSHLTEYLLRHDLVDQIVLADIKPIREDFSFDPARVSYVELDVRKPVSEWQLPVSVQLIANFAAVHREPGHELAEYYETNLPGAENVCAWAEQVGCQNIIFTSSIAPYGPTEEVKTEVSIPTPTSGYGGSKLAAEKIHLCWQRAGTGRRLVIARPGVVFGPGERGNVTRLVQATLRRYFFYMGNRATRKAGGYVKELTNTMIWALNRIPATGGALLYNFSAPQAPSVQDYVDAACKVACVSRFVPSVPYRFLLVISYLIETIASPLGIKQPISPVRIRKLVRSNNIEPAVLKHEGYAYQYTLETAMQDWRKDRPEEWQ